MVKPGRLLSLVSNVVPIRLIKIKTSRTKNLKLFLHKKHFRLQYGKVLYSDGVDYFPFRLGFSKIKSKLPQHNRVLVLGAGIGSIGMMLQKAFPDKKWEIDFVDISESILGICQYVMGFYPNIQATYHHVDALEFVQTYKTKYDLICVDVFNESVVPEKILSPAFLHFLNQIKHDTSNIVMNTMFKSRMQKDIFESHLEEVFPQFSKIEEQHNVIFIV